MKSPIRINLKETKIFPCDTFKVKILDNPNEGPHISISQNSTWIKFSVDTGNVIKIKGDDENILFYIKTNVKKWLDSPCALLPKITNRENALITWFQVDE